MNRIRFQLRYNKLTSALTLPVLFLFLILLTYQIGNGILRARGVESGALDWLYRAGFIWSIVWWLELDSKRHRVGQPYCLGLLTTTGIFILLPYHLVRTRGARGLLLILAFFVMLILCGVLGLLAFEVMGGQLVQ